MLIFFSISAVMVSPIRSIESRASARPLGRSAMPVVNRRPKNESSSSDQGVNALEIAAFQQALALRHEFRRRGHLNPHFPEKPRNRRDEVDRQQENAPRPITARPPSHPEQGVLGLDRFFGSRFGRGGRVSPSAAGLSASAAGFLASAAAFSASAAAGGFLSCAARRPGRATYAQAAQSSAASRTNVLLRDAPQAMSIRFDPSLFRRGTLR